MRNLENLDNKTFREKLRENLKVLREKSCLGKILEI